MPSKPKSGASVAPDANLVKKHIAAMARHSAALQAHADAMTAAAPAQGAMTTALKNNTAALAASKPHKTQNQKTADAMACISQWLMQAKGISQADSTNPSKNMSTDFRIGGPQEMQLCLEAVQICLAGKGDIYHLDTTSPNANAHLIKLMSGTLGAVVADIVSNMT